MENNKKWYFSLTIVSALIVLSCMLMLILDTPTALGPEFTTNELCDWAEAQSNNQFRLIILQIAMGGCILVMVGRIRAKGGSSK